MTGPESDERHWLRAVAQIVAGVLVVLALVALFIFGAVAFRLIFR